MAALFNDQPVCGVRLVPDGTKMYLGRRTIGLRDAGAALISGNIKTLGVAVLGADQAIYNDQPVLGAVLISDARTLYNNERVVPAKAISGTLA